MKTCLSILIASIALLLAGCESNGIANRINEKSAAFATLSPEEKSYIQDGIVFPGYSEDMAYVAFGKPSSIDTKQANGTPVQIWTYKKFYPSGALETMLTDYSRVRNPNLLRSLDIQSGSGTVSDHAPDSGGANPLRSSGAGSSTGTAGTMGSLSLPDVPVYNLYVYIVDNKVAEMQLESLDGTKF